MHAHTQLDSPADFPFLVRPCQCERQATYDLKSTIRRLHQPNAQRAGAREPHMQDGHEIRRRGSFRLLSLCQAAVHTWAQQISASGINFQPAVVRCKLTLQWGQQLPANIAIDTLLLIKIFPDRGFASTLALVLAYGWLIKR